VKVIVALPLRGSPATRSLADYREEVRRWARVSDLLTAHKTSEANRKLHAKQRQRSPSTGSV